MTFVLQHFLAFLLVLCAAAGAGTLLLGTRDRIALRTAAGFAVLSAALFLLGLSGALTREACSLVLVTALAGGALRLDAAILPRIRTAAIAAVVFTPLFVLSLYPPLAFDETLYHLPFVRAFAETGSIGFFAYVRFGMFPPFQELLCLIPFLLFGDTATHVVPLAQTVVTAALLHDYVREKSAPAPWFAAALFLGSPLVVYVAATGYVEAGLTMFIAAAFTVLARSEVPSHRDAVLAGVLLGAAVGVKYTALFFLASAFVLLVLRTRDWRRSMAFAAGAALVVLPVLGTIAWHTSNPLYPYAARLFGPNIWEGVTTVGLDPRPKLARGATLLYDVTFARHRAGLVPPVTPFLIPAVAVVAIGALRHNASRAVLAMLVAWIAILMFAPPEARYLVPLLPLLFAVATERAGAWFGQTRRAPVATAVLAVLAVLPGVTYAAYRSYLTGPVPVNAAMRERLLTRYFPEYPALKAAGTSTVYVCHAENLHYYADGRFLGDVAGPYAYDRFLAGNPPEPNVPAMRRAGAEFYLAPKRRCSSTPPDGARLVYEDAYALLWQLE